MTRPRKKPKPIDLVAEADKAIDATYVIADLVTNVPPSEARARARLAVFLAKMAMYEVKAALGDLADQGMLP